MKTVHVILTLCLLLASNQAMTQSENRNNFRNFPIVLSLQFHSLSMPFKDLKTNFSNIGFGVGTELSYNGSHNWAQKFDIIWIKNKGIGNSVLFSTQAAWRPMIAGNVYTEIKVGIGYMKAFRPSESFNQSNGRWISAGKKGKGMLTIPVGIGMGYFNYSEGMFISPFASYQMMLVNNYNLDLPYMPQSIIQIGSRIHPNNPN